MLKIKFILALCLTAFLPALLCAQQYKYSIDIEPVKTRKAPESFFSAQQREVRQAQKAYHKKKEEQKKLAKKTRKHSLSIQTRAVRKRMKRSEKLALYHTTGKKSISLRSKIKQNGRSWSNNKRGACCSLLHL